MNGARLAIGTASRKGMDVTLAEEKLAEMQQLGQKDYYGRIALKPKSAYAALELQTAFGESILGALSQLGKQRILRKSTAEIDAYFYRRQEALLPGDILDVAKKIVDDFEYNSKIFRNIVDRDAVADPILAAQKTAARQRAAANAEGQIADAISELRAKGYSNISELDIMDAIAYQGRLNRVGVDALEDFTGMSDLGDTSKIRDLAMQALNRRRYSMLVTDKSFAGSDTAKIMGVMDRALSLLPLRARQAKLAQFSSLEADRNARSGAEAIYGFLRRLSEDAVKTTAQLTGKKGAQKKIPGTGATLDDLVNGIMTLDEFYRIVGKPKNLIGNFQDEDYGFMRMSEGLHAEHVEIRASAINANHISEQEANRQANHAQGILHDLDQIYKARYSGIAESEMEMVGNKLRMKKLIIPADRNVQKEPVKKSPYKRVSSLIKDGTISNLMKKPYLKGTAMSMIGLAAFGLIYSASADKNIDEMGGPPLLPGGSAYETAYPGNTLNLPVPQYIMNSGENGVTYKVNISGDSNTAKDFVDSARGMSMGSSSVNYFNSIQNINRNPYEEFGSSL